MLFISFVFVVFHSAIPGLLGAGQQGFKFDASKYNALIAGTETVGIVNFKEDPVGWRGLMYTGKTCRRLCGACIPLRNTQLKLLAFAPL